MIKCQHLTPKKSEDYYKKFELDAEKYTNEVLKSIKKQDKIIIASGPGTGKSSLFKKICELKRNDNNLTLSFINELVDDLHKEIGNVSEVKTLHSFALEHIRGHKKYHIGLEDVISEDYEIIYGKKINFKKILCKLINDKEVIKFFFKRQQYYGYHSPNSSVYRLAQFYYKNKDKIPSYSQILIDEYQDFNKLESTLIGLLAINSPIIIVGDDDQSLYGWKFADPGYIRSKHESTKYEKLDLPYCFRCSNVIVRTYNDIIQYAKSKGYLHTKRIEKIYKYFPTEKKDNVSNLYNKISLTGKAFKPTTIAYVIDKQIKEFIDPKLKETPSVLIIFPNKLKRLISLLDNCLKKKGYKYIDSPIVNKKEEIIESLNLLLKSGNSSCNLSWRLVVRGVLSKTVLHKAVKKSHQNNNQTNFLDLLEVDHRSLVKKLRASILKIIKNENNVKMTDKEKGEVFDKLGYDPIDIASSQLTNDFEDISRQNKNPYKNIPIKITTILGSKGLNYDFVFMVNFDDKFIFKDGEIKPENINELLVALTRARKKVSILTTTNSVPSYLNWIDKKNIEKKEYIKFS